MSCLRENVRWAIEDYIGEYEDALTQVFTDFLEGNIIQADLEHECQMVAGIPVHEVAYILDVMDDGYCIDVDGLLAQRS